jgi:hypothetical protein
LERTGLSPPWQWIWAFLLLLYSVSFCTKVSVIAQIRLVLP